MDSLIDKTSPKAIKTALKALPRGSDALDLAYDQAMERIYSQKPGFRNLAERVLEFIIYAVRPLHVLELQHALAVEIGQPTLDCDNITDVGELISVCAGLVKIDQRSSTQLVHYTVQEYLKRSRSRYFPDAQQKLAATCLTYLTFDKFRSGPCKSSDEFRIRRLENPFYLYASRNWVHHVREDTEITQLELMLKFLFNDDLVSSAYEASMTSMTFARRRACWSVRPPLSVTGLHLAAFLGLDVFVTKLLEAGISPNVRNSFDQTLLLVAAIQGHATTAAVLLKHKDVDVNISDQAIITPLHAAVQSGREVLVKTLLSLSKVDVNSLDQDGRSPLISALQYRAMNMVELLLARDDVSINQVGVGGYTALTAAIHYNGPVESVKMLLAKGATFDFKSDTDETILHLIAQGGHSEVLRILLEDHNGSILQMLNTSDSRGFTPAATAAANGHIDVLKILLQIGALDCVETKHMQTCLHVATLKGNLAAVKTLLDHGADPKHQDVHEWNAVTFAQAYEQEAVYRHLLLSCTTSSCINVGIPPNRYNDALYPDHPSLDDDGLVITLSEYKKSNCRQWRGNHPVPFGVQSFYFELTVKDQGDKG